VDYLFDGWKTENYVFVIPHFSCPGPRERGPFGAINLIV